MRKFPPGKIPWDHIAQHIREALPPEVLLGPACGEDAALVKIGGEIWAVASDPITFTSTQGGRLSVIVNANDVAVRGATPLYYTAVVLVSPDQADDESVSSLLREIRSSCEDLGIALIGGHTEVAPGLPHTIIAGTMLGKVTTRPITSGGLREGDIVGMTKWAGMEGTSILLNDFAERLHEFHGPHVFREAEDVFGKDWLSVVADATIAAACPQVSALHDVTEGGVGEALYEMAVASGLHIRVEPGRVPILPATKTLCSDFGIEPFGLIGSGSLLVGCAEEGKEALEAALAERGIPFSWIGQVKCAEDEPSSTLPRYERDEILKVWLLEGLEACVFDMDGTLIDSNYDWQAIRSALGVSGASILEHLDNLKGEEQKEKWQRLHEFEQKATQTAKAKPAASDLLSLLRRQGIKTALVTNNSDRNVSYLMEKFGLRFDVVVTRDSGLYKPSGAPVAEAVRRLNFPREKTLCVGDSLYDIIACREAGCGWVCILFDEKHICSPNADLSFPDINAFIRYLNLVL